VPQCHRQFARISPTFTSYLAVRWSVRAGTPRRFQSTSGQSRYYPRSAEAYNALGNALHALGQQEKAISCYRRALDDPPIILRRPITTWALRWRPATGLPRRRTSMSGALKIEPSAEAHADLGNALANLGRPNDAEAEYRKALDMKLKPRRDDSRQLGHPVGRPWAAS